MSTQDPNEPLDCGHTSMDHQREILEALIAALGDEYEISEPETVDVNQDKQNPNVLHSAFMLGIRRKDGQEVDQEYIERVIRASGLPLGGLGDVHALFGPRAPDSLNDLVVASVHPESMNEKYGERANDFVEQLAIMLGLEWAEVTGIFIEMLKLAKEQMVNEHVMEHLMIGAIKMVRQAALSRQHVGGLLEGYRRDNSLDAEQMITLTMAAVNQMRSTVDEGSYETSMLQDLRTVYTGADERDWDFTFPPFNQDLFQRIWEDPDSPDIYGGKSEGKE